MTRQQPRVTLATIATEAGVSLATVSKVLNGRVDVASTTRLRVEGHLARHGYTRRVPGRRGGYLEIVFHELESAWSLKVIEGVELAATAAGLSVVLTVSGSRHAPAPDWLEGVLRRRPVGVVLVFADISVPHREQLRSRGIPFVIVDPAGDPAPEVPSVGSANWAGGLSATRHLIELGHRRIAAITGPADMMCSLARLDGYRTAMNAAGLAIDPAWVRYGDFQPTGGAAITREILELADRPTAIFAGSDLQAVGAMRAVREAGLSVPEDLSIVGYDDIAMSMWMSPSLTTVHQPITLMGETAANLVIKLSSGGEVETLRMDLATHLVVRESTAPPR